MRELVVDKYSDSRGGWSRVLDVCCEHCSKHVAFYQKDGPGNLRRMYTDRFIDIKPAGESLLCEDCGRVLGTRIVYEKENREAYRLYVDAVTKRIVGRAVVPIR